jgi:hypothetical protein
MRSRMAWTREHEWVVTVGTVICSAIVLSSWFTGQSTLQPVGKCNSRVTMDEPGLMLTLLT